MKSALQRLLGYFLAGVFAVLPLVITAAVVIWLTGFLEEMIGPDTVVGGQLRNFGLHFSSDSTLAYVIGWTLVLAVLFLLGIVVELGAKNFLSQLMDALLQRIPIIGSLYGTSKQLVEMLDKKNESELKGMQVVFCTFGKEGGAAVLALMPSPETFTINGLDYHVIIIPTAPVPFGGGLFFVPKQSVVAADMSVDGLMSIYVSMGVTTGQFITPPEDLKA